MWKIPELHNVFRHLLMCHQIHIKPIACFFKKHLGKTIVFYDINCAPDWHPTDTIYIPYLSVCVCACQCVCMCANASGRELLPPPFHPTSVCLLTIAHSLVQCFYNNNYVIPFRRASVERECFVFTSHFGRHTTDFVCHFFFVV